MCQSYRGSLFECLSHRGDRRVQVEFGVSVMEPRAERALLTVGQLSPTFSRFPEVQVPSVLEGKGCETSRPESLRPHVSADLGVSHPCALFVPLESDTQRQLRDR